MIDPEYRKQLRDMIMYRNSNFTEEMLNFHAMHEMVESPEDAILAQMGHLPRVDEELDSQQSVAESDSKPSQLLTERQQHLEEMLRK